MRTGEKKEPFVPVGNTNRDKRVRQPRGAAPFVPAWRSRLGNRDNRGFPTGTSQRFCSSILYSCKEKLYQQKRVTQIYLSTNIVLSLV